MHGKHTMSLGSDSLVEGKVGSFLESEILRHKFAYIATNLGAVTALAKILEMIPSKTSTEEIPTSITCSLRESKLSNVILFKILHHNIKNCPKWSKINQNIPSSITKGGGSGVTCILVDLVRIFAGDKRSNRRQQGSTRGSIVIPVARTTSLLSSFEVANTGATVVAEIPTETWLVAHARRGTVATISHWATEWGRWALGCWRARGILSIESEDDLHGGKALRSLGTDVLEGEKELTGIHLLAGVGSCWGPLLRGLEGCSRLQECVNKHT